MTVRKSAVRKTLEVDAIQYRKMAQRLRRCLNALMAISSRATPRTEKEAIKFFLLARQLARKTIEKVTRDPG